MLGSFGLPISVITNSTQPNQFQQEEQEASLSGVFRTSFQQDPADQRILFYGIRYIIESYVDRQWTLADVARAPHWAPRDLLTKVVAENQGYLPISVWSVREGSVVTPGEEVLLLKAKAPYIPLLSFLVSVLSMIWYPTAVATLSRRCRDRIQKAFIRSVDEAKLDKVREKLRDFGFRGCTSVEQSIQGGSAHLVNFDGSATLSACYHAQFYWNNGKPVGICIPGTEHSVMTSHPTELEAMMKLIDTLGTGVYACVMDSYDYANALASLLPKVAMKKLEKGGVLILRPDSGDPVETVLMALRAGEKVFGCQINEKGFKVLQGCGVVQGDGIGPVAMTKILDAAMDEGYSACNLTFGMGGGLLQKVSNDTLNFHIQPKVNDGITPEENSRLRLVYNEGPITDANLFENFDQVRLRADEGWGVYSV